VPDGVSPFLPGFLDLGGLDSLDGAGREVLLAGGDLDPDVDGRDLALAVAEFGLWARNRRQPPG
jgi:hypothetical protein